jgi:hypothetical protein
MKNFIRASKAETNQQHNSSSSGFWNSVNHSNWFGKFGLFRSPLFGIMTLSVMVITVLLTLFTQNPKISILSGLILELLIVLVTWQYLLLSSRLENILTKTASLESIVKNSESTSAEHLTELNITIYSLQSLLGKVGSDLSRTLQSDKEMKRAVTLFCEHVISLCDHIEDWQIQHVDRAKAIEQLVHQQLKHLQDNLTEMMSEQTARINGEVLIAYSQQFGTTLTLFEKQVAALEIIVLGSGTEDGEKNETDKENAACKALEVSTALDRLNLELRRQLVALRQELAIPDQPMQ